MKSDKVIPEFLMTSERGSFSRKCVMVRMPQIVENVIADNDYSFHVVEKLRVFEREISKDQVQPLTEKVSDVEMWNGMWLSNLKGKTWLEVPWYFGESYFYRRLLEIVGYFREGPLRGLDPFDKPKKRELEESIVSLKLIMDIEDEFSNGEAAFERLLHGSLWGNRIDLTNSDIVNDFRHKKLMVERENLLIDDFAKVLRAFKKGAFSHVAFFSDNVGVELGFDLALADFLLQKKWVSKVTFFLKPSPFYVSDAMIKDFENAIQQFEEDSKIGLSKLGTRAREAMLQGKIILSTEWFWSSFHHFPEMPRFLRKEIAKSDLIISKGDLNYRRLLGDRHWSHTAPIRDIISYFPIPILILRTLKAEIIVGLHEGVSERICSEDPEWLTNGKRGLIQYVEK